QSTSGGLVQQGSGFDQRCDPPSLSRNQWAKKKPHSCEWGVRLYLLGGGKRYRRRRQVLHDADPGRFKRGGAARANACLFMVQLRSLAALRGVGSLRGIRGGSADGCIGE